MSDYARREFERLGIYYRDGKLVSVPRCPDYLTQDAINQLAVSHSRMKLTICQYEGCGAECRQFDWSDEPSTCQICRVTR